MLEKKLDKQVLKKKFDFAVRQMVREWRASHWGTEEIYAMSFRMDYNNTDIKRRFQCKVMIQTKEGCAESMKERCGEESGSERLLDFKYVPQKYKYAEDGLDGFQRVQEYLYENCLGLETCERLEDLDARETMHESIRNQTLEIERILAETIIKLRREKFLTSDHHDKEFYVFPYFQGDDLPGNYIMSARKMNEGLDLTEYLEYMEGKTPVNLEVSVPEPKKTEDENISTGKNRKIDKQILKKKFDFAVRQMVRVCLEKYGEEGMYAMCFRMHYDSADTEGRFLCEVIVQTKKGCEESMGKYIGEKKRGREEYRSESLLYYKYIPEEYKYAEDGLDGFQGVQEYLYENCLNLEECRELEDFDMQDEMYENIARQALETEEVLAEAVAGLRRKKFLTDYDGREFYVFPYIGEDDLPGNYIPLAQKMNEGLDLTEYLEFIESEFVFSE